MVYLRWDVTVLGGGGWVGGGGLVGGGGGGGVSKSRYKSQGNRSPSFT